MTSQKQQSLDWDELKGTGCLTLILAIPSWMLWLAFVGPRDETFRSILYWVVSVPCLFLGAAFSGTRVDQGNSPLEYRFFRSLGICGFGFALIFNPFVPIHLGLTLWRLFDLMVLIYFGTTIIATGLAKRRPTTPE